LSDDFATRLTYAIGVPEETELTLDEIIQKITKYYKDKTNIIVVRKELLLRKQKEGESFDDFLVDLQERADDADIQTMTPEEWRTTLLVCGLRDRELQKKVLSKKPALNLEATINECRVHEGGEESTDSLRSRRHGVGAVRGRGGGRGGHRGRSSSRERGRSSSRERSCYACGGKFPHENVPCKAKGKTCRDCSQVGHFAGTTFCQKSKEKSDASGTTKSNAKKTGAVLIAQVRSRIETRPVIAVDFHDLKGEFLDNFVSIADTGAEMTIMGMRMLRRMGLNKSHLDKPSESLMGVNGSELRCQGSKNLRLTVGGRSIVEQVTFCSDVDEVYLSYNHRILKAGQHFEFSLHFFYQLSP